VVVLVVVALLADGKIIHLIKITEMKNAFKFSEADKTKIEESVARLEKETSGELVPYFVNKSDDYIEVSWFLAAVFGAFGLLLVFSLSLFWSLPYGISMMEIFAFPIMLMVIGYFLPVLFPTLKAYPPGQQKIDQRVMQRAMEAYLECGIFNTLQRSGILLFISELEHEVVILADEGISKQVDKGVWQDIVDALIVKIKSEQITEGICEAIDDCRVLLIEKGFNKKTDDPNQLPDGLIEG
jgi:putative membrane protein